MWLGLIGVCMGIAWRDDSGLDLDFVFWFFFASSSIDSFMNAREILLNLWMYIAFFYLVMMLWVLKVHAFEELFPCYFFCFIAFLWLAGKCEEIPSISLLKQQWIL